jgi:RNA polymerase sigma-70 factor, ECF subfamily
VPRDRAAAVEREPSDEALMRRLACDDTGAFDTLFLRHQRAVFHVALRMVGDPGTAEDLTQECFLRVWRARHHYQPTAAFRTWLFTIVRRLALDTRRRRAPGVSLCVDAGSEANLPLSPELAERLAQTDPEALIVGRELKRRLERAIQELPEALREAVVLREMAEMSYDEMARVMGCPVGTVKSRLNAARRRLRAVALEWLEAS